MSTLKRKLRRGLKQTGDAVAGALAVGFLRALRGVNPDRMADIGGAVMRTIGPLFRENKIARDQLTAAFPEKTPAEIEKILAGTWDNIGHMGAEFAHLDRLWDFDADNPKKDGRIQLNDADIERFRTLLNDGKPALIFAAHLANWELPAICAATYKLDSAVLYRRPNIKRLNDWITETRSATMGELISTGLDAPMKISQALERGAHVGMLVDQYYVRGVEVTFFGRKTRANPLIARLAQHFDCPIHGTRIIRLPGNRFRAELTDEIQPVRDADGKVDIAGTMQQIITVIEGWVREYPEQWLWQHRRWRPEDDAPTS
ncbi:lipid A biosynthesis lauroyl acyltransferase [Pseudolabrys taiwanensis]|uniref:Lipid A biosynthesis lauroyl acyltransferase n=1 Tax=Pseudolabrys taiwanensis TaxID=331696 RepID=A0A345ZQZ8_9HYPH|nr:lipid A biosynthesis lauroyl acyltransferase [Pseudolabrys taiwanensis]AXK79345.1 lipid A biosynthesis lauroyl acyltransferase [Pseudolabrys taiwanensis]